MSDTPIIIASYDDLERFYDETGRLETGARYKDLDDWKHSAYCEIKCLFQRKGNPLRIKGVRFIIIRSDLTERNQDIRSCLNEMNVEYALEY